MAVADLKIASANEVFPSAPSLGGQWRLFAPAITPAQNDNAVNTAAETEQAQASALTNAPDQISLSQKIDNLIESGDHNAAYSLMLSNFSNLSEILDADAWMEFLSLCDYVSDKMRENGQEALADQMDYQSARPGSVDPEGNILPHLDAATMIELSLDRNSITPSHGLAQMIEDLKADVQNYINRTLTLESVDPAGTTKRPDATHLDILLKELTTDHSTPELKNDPELKRAKHELGEAHMHLIPFA